MNTVIVIWENNPFTVTTHQICTSWLSVFNSGDWTASSGRVVMFLLLRKFSFFAALRSSTHSAIRRSRSFYRQEDIDILATIRLFFFNSSNSGKIVTIEGYTCCHPVMELEGGNDPKPKCGKKKAEPSTNSTVWRIKV